MMHLEIVATEMVLHLFLISGLIVVNGLDPTATPTTGCDSGWIPYDAACYFLGDESVVYLDGKRACKKSAAELVTVLDAEHNSFLQTEFGGFDFWLSLTDEKEEGNWVWSGGQSDYSNWAAGQPNGNHSEDCAVLNGTTGFWSDESCELGSFYYVCERDTPTEMPTTAPPTPVPTANPTKAPTKAPSHSPTKAPTHTPSKSLTVVPTANPTRAPTNTPSNSPTAFLTATEYRSGYKCGSISVQLYNSQGTVRTCEAAAQNEAACYGYFHFKSNSGECACCQEDTQDTGTSSNLYSVYNYTVTANPTTAPTSTPSNSPTAVFTAIPTRAPTNTPSNIATSVPTAIPTRALTNTPSNSATSVPTAIPTRAPTNTPSNSATSVPTANQTRAPTNTPSNSPTAVSTANPTRDPTDTPSNSSTAFPTDAPSRSPTRAPTVSPTLPPTDSRSFPATSVPTQFTSATSTNVSTIKPSGQPSASPSTLVSEPPSFSPTFSSSLSPTLTHSTIPSNHPTPSPTIFISSFIPTLFPTNISSIAPTISPTSEPSFWPSTAVTEAPSTSPTFLPSISPLFTPFSSTVPSTVIPSVSSTVLPSNTSTLYDPLVLSINPTTNPTNSPTGLLNAFPDSSTSASPSFTPTDTVTTDPSFLHTNLSSFSEWPRESTSHVPTFYSSWNSTPSMHPTTYLPSNNPSIIPSSSPSFTPTQSPAVAPSQLPVTSAPSTLLIPSTENISISTTYANQSAVSTPLTNLSSMNFPPHAVLDFYARIGMCANLSIDASQTSGSMGRPILFRWELLSPTHSSSATELARLASMANGDQLVLPNHLLEDGENYLIQATATNVAGLSDSATANISYLPASIPFVKISGITTISRNDQLSLYTDFVPHACGNSSSMEWTFSWSVKEMPGLVSSSPMPTRFALSPFSLESGQTYTVLVTVTDIEGHQNWASISVHVSKGNLIARISGGSVQVIEIENEAWLIGSGSLDEDQTNGQVSDNASVTWSCFLDETPCGFELNNTSLDLYIPPNVLNADSMYFFALSIVDGDRYSNASVTLHTTPEDVPITKITASQTSLNSGEKLVLEGVASELIDSGLSAWSVASSNTEFMSTESLEYVALTNLMVAFAQDSVVSHYLVVSSGELVPGSSYTFQFSVSYNSDASGSYAKVEITVNSPPIAGSLLVKPDSGDAVSDEFYFSATGFDDEVDNLPLAYLFSYVRQGETTMQLLQSFAHIATQQPQVYLPQGRAEHNYTLDCTVTAYNQLGAEVSQSAAVVVRPYAARIADALSEADGFLSTFLSSYDMERTHGIIRAMGSFLVGPNCTLSPDCSVLNRFHCDVGTVDHVCGACLDGFYGSLSNWSTPCLPVLPATGTCANGLWDFGSESDVDCGSNCPPCSEGHSCSNDWDCLSNICDGGTCVVGSKLCPNLCSGVGTCYHYGPDQEKISAEDCLVDDLYCEAKCTCDEGFEGESCQYSIGVYGIREEFRAVLISSLNMTLDWLEGTPLETQQAINSLTAATGPSGFLSSDLQSQVFSIVSWAAIKASSNGISQEISQNWLELYAQQSLSLDAETFLSPLNDMATALSLDLFPGEKAASIVTNKVRLTSAVYGAGEDISSFALSLPLTESEIAQFKSSSSVMVNIGDLLTPLEEFTLSASALLQSPYAPIDTNNSINLAEFVTIRLPFIQGNRRYLEEHSINIHLELENLYAQDFPAANETMLRGYCNQDEYSLKQLLCQGEVYTYECDGMAKTVEATCSFSAPEPRCSLWDGNDWDTSLCNVLSYNSTRTICNCSLPLILDRKLNEDIEEGPDEHSSYTFTATTNKVAIEIQANLASISQLSISSVQQSLVVFITMGFFLIIIPCTALLTSFRCHHQKQFKKKHQKMSVKFSRVTKSFKSFKMGADQDIHESLPHFWNRRAGISAFVENLFEQSIWLSVVKCDGNLNEKVHHATLLVVLVLSFMFWDATLFGVFFPPTDDTYCNQWQDSQTCEQSFEERCTWDEEGRFCYAIDFDPSLEIVLYIMVISTVLTLPIAAMMELIMERTIMLPMPSEDYDSTPKKQPATQPTETGRGHGLKKSRLEAKVLQRVSSHRHIYEQKQMESDMKISAPCFYFCYESIASCCRKKIRQKRTRLLHQLTLYDVEDLMFEERVKQEVDLFERELNAKEGPHLWRRWVPKTLLRPLILYKIRCHVRHAIQLENEFEVLEKKGATSLEKNMFLLRAAQMDYLSTFELQASKYMLQHMHKKKCGEEDKAPESVLSVKVNRSNVVKLRIFGWVIVACFCIFHAFYICLFGINYGPLYANTWLLSFLLGVVEDLCVIQPLKLLALYILFPLVVSPKFEIHRIVNLPSFASSAQLARKYSDLPVSQMIVLRSPNLISDNLVEYLRYSRKWSAQKMLQRALLLSLIGLAILLMSILPIGFQEAALEAWIVALCNMSLIAFKWCWDNNTVVFAVFLVFTALIVFYGLYKAVALCRNKKFVQEMLTNATQLGQASLTSAHLRQASSSKDGSFTAPKGSGFAAPKSFMGSRSNIKVDFSNLEQDAEEVSEAESLLSPSHPSSKGFGLKLQQFYPSSNPKDSVELKDAKNHSFPSQIKVQDEKIPSKDVLPVAPPRRLNRKADQKGSLISLASSHEIDQEIPSMDVHLLQARRLNSKADQLGSLSLVASNHELGEQIPSKDMPPLPVRLNSKENQLGSPSSVVKNYETGEQIPSTDRHLLPARRLNSKEDQMGSPLPVANSNEIGKHVPSMDMPLAPARRLNRKADQKGSLLSIASGHEIGKDFQGKNSIKKIESKSLKTTELHQAQRCTPANTDIADNDKANDSVDETNAKQPSPVTGSISKPFKRSYSKAKMKSGNAPLLKPAKQDVQEKPEILSWLDESSTSSVGK